MPRPRLHFQSLASDKSKPGLTNLDSKTLPRYSDPHEKARMPNNGNEFVYRMRLSVGLLLLTQAVELSTSENAFRFSTSITCWLI